MYDTDDIEEYVRQTNKVRMGCAMLVIVTGMIILIAIAFIGLISFN